MSQLTFDQYESHARSTSYFLADPELSHRWEIVTYGYREEVNELLTDSVHPAELKALYWGREIGPESRLKLQKSKTSEAGDVLFYVTAAGFLHEVPLKDIGARAVELFSGETVGVDDIRLQDVDEAAFGKIEPQVPEWYEPDYFGLQFWGVSPFKVGHDAQNQFDEAGDVVHGPLMLKADGLYALERLARSYGEYINMYDAHFHDEYLREAALLLGGLSAILQHSFSSSLAEAATVNMQKRERRAAANALQAGTDMDRSRPAGMERPRLTGWESTQLNLFYGLPADNI